MARGGGRRAKEKESGRAKAKNEGETDRRPKFFLTNALPSLALSHAAHSMLSRVRAAHGVLARSLVSTTGPSAGSGAAWRTNAVLDRTDARPASSTSTSPASAGPAVAAVGSTLPSPATGARPASTSATSTSPSSALDALLEDALREAKSAGTFKVEREIQGPQGPLITVGGKSVLNFCGNQYLGRQRGAGIERERRREAVAAVRATSDEENGERERERGVRSRARTGVRAGVGRFALSFFSH